jgi:hypothetical protein
MIFSRSPLTIPVGYDSNRDEHHPSRILLLLFTLLMLTLLASLTPVSLAQEKPKDPNEGKKGKTIGMLTEKSEKFIEVKADGEEKARRYVPQWVGGNPDKGGGPDKKTVKTFLELKVGSRVEVEWVYEERFRALKVTVLALPK